MSYLRWCFKDSRLIEEGKEIISDTWDPSNPDWEQRGGINFSNEENIIRWIARGDTLYEVEIPEDAEVINVNNKKTPNGIFATNKIIMKNPKPVSDELTMNLYKKSNMPLKTYFETIAALAIRGCYNTSLEIIKDKVNMDNINEAIYEYTNFIKPWHEGHINYEIYNSVLEVLNEIKSSKLINLFIDKDPYTIEITDDNVINLTGQSGSGKTTYAKKYFNSDEYLIIDTDDIFSDNRYENAMGINKELGEYFRSKYDTLPNCGDNFDLIYKEILEYCKKYHKTIVIDCAQFHCIKDIGILKGKLIIIRTCINNCYNRTIERYKKITTNYTEEDLNKYIEKKKSLFKWYKYSNNFIKNIDNFIKNRDEHIKSIRNRLTNKDFSLFTNNCLAGFIYHDLGLKFLSPTINLRIKPKEFISFVSDLDYYLNQEIVEIKDSNQSIPVGIIEGDAHHDSVTINFDHYLTFEEAKEKWIDRSKRVNYDNIIVMMEFYDGIHNEELIKMFKDIPYKKIILTHKDHDENYTTAIHCFDDNLDMSEIGGKIFRYDGITGKRFYDEFDYIEFLNKGIDPNERK